MKICNVCREARGLECFHRRTASADGLGYTCKQCVGALRKKTYALRVDHYKAEATRWARENPERRKEIRLKSAEKHRESKREKSRIYQRQKRILDPEKERAKGRRYTALRRAREQDNGGYISQGWWDALFALFEFKTCLYCGSDNCDLVMDHFVPVRLGGRTEMGNLLPCCRSCNGRKNAKHPREWLTPQAFADIDRFLGITADAARSSLTEKPHG